MTPQHRRDCQRGVTTPAVGREEVQAPATASAVHIAHAVPAVHHAAASSSGGSMPSERVRTTPVVPIVHQAAKAGFSSGGSMRTASHGALNPAACGVAAGAVAGGAALGAAVGGLVTSAAAVLAVATLIVLVFALPQQRKGKSLMATFRYQDGVNVAMNNPKYAKLFPTDVPVECRPPCLMHVVRTY